MIATGSYKSPEEKWDWVVANMTYEDPFAHAFLMMMLKSPSTRTPTMGVRVEDALIHLRYNPDFIKSLDEAEHRGCLTHEVLHVVLHHCTTRLPVDDVDKKRHNVAADLAVNSLIKETVNLKLPRDHITHQPIGVFPNQFKFPEKLSKEQYLQLLTDNNIDCSQYVGSDEHEGWTEADAEIIKEMIRGKVEQLSKLDKIWGKLPGDLQSAILAAQKSSTPWWRYLRHYAGNLDSTKLEPTFKRPNKRFGYPYSGTKRSHVDRVLVAVDRSMSCMSPEDQGYFLSEVNRLAEVQPVDVVSFDVGIHGRPVVFDRRRLSFTYQGGAGGTSFTEVFEYADAHHYKSLIVLTDGEAAAIEHPCYVKDVIWVLTSLNKKPPVDWGKRVYITPKGVPQPQ
jgi:predicted metal-dependent peptidase